MAEKNLKVKISADNKEFTKKVDEAKRKAEGVGTAGKFSFQALTKAIGVSTAAVDIIVKGFKDWAKVIKTLVIDRPIDQMKEYIELIKLGQAAMQGSGEAAQAKESRRQKLLARLSELNESDASFASRKGEMAHILQELKPLTAGLKGVDLWINSSTGKVVGLERAMDATFRQDKARKIQRINAQISEQKKLISALDEKLKHDSSAMGAVMNGTAETAVGTAKEYFTATQQLEKLQSQLADAKSGSTEEYRWKLWQKTSSEKNKQMQAEWDAMMANQEQLRKEAEHEANIRRLKEGGFEAERKAAKEKLENQLKNELDEGKRKLFLDNYNAKLKDIAAREKDAEEALQEQKNKEYDQRTAEYKSELERQKALHDKVLSAEREIATAKERYEEALQKKKVANLQKQRDQAQKQIAEIDKRLAGFGFDVSKAATTAEDVKTRRLDQRIAAKLDRQSETGRKATFTYNERKRFEEAKGLTEQKAKLELDTSKLEDKMERLNDTDKELSVAITDAKNAIYTAQQGFTAATAALQGNSMDSLATSIKELGAKIERMQFQEIRLYRN